jgi:hypothetical protein
MLSYHQQHILVSAAASLAIVVFYLVFRSTIVDFNIYWQPLVEDMTKNDARN